MSVIPDNLEPAVVYLLRRIADSADNGELMLPGVWAREAAAIVVHLPVPIDPDVLIVRQLIAEDESLNDYRHRAATGELDDKPVMRLCLAALRRGRDIASPM